MDYHGRIMNIRRDGMGLEPGEYTAGYQLGHKEARYAAAEIAAEADAEIARLRAERDAALSDGAKLAVEGAKIVERTDDILRQRGLALDRIGKLEAELAAERAAVARLEAGRDDARSAVDRIGDWAAAYPEDVFAPLSDDEVRAVAAAMEAAVSNGSSRMHASWARHIFKGASRYVEEARAALAGRAP